MAARLRFLSAERRTETIDFAKRRRRRFVVELTRLRQISLLAVEVIDFKKRRRSFTGGGREDWRISKREAIVVEKVRAPP